MALTVDLRTWQRPGISEILRALGADEGLVRFVGGTVRDELLKLPHQDIDLATRIPPDEVVRRLEAARIKAVPTGIEHGTITAISQGQPVEVTTLRRDVSTDGRRATVAFTDDWREDAARRDFTINALSADPRTGEIFDYFGGVADLDERRVRFIGDPRARIAEDHLRILRFFRFHARFGSAEPDAQALEACSERAKDLMALSRERIADELLKLLGLDDPAPTVELMIERAILAPVLPEIEARALDLLRQVIATEKEAGLPPHALRRLSALLPPEPLLAEKVAARLKLSNKARKRIACAAERGTDISPQALAYRVGSECAVDRLLVSGNAEQAASVTGWPVPRLPIGGGTLIARGLPEGPIVARTLRRIEDRWIEAGFPAGDELERIVGSELRSAQ